MNRSLLIMLVTLFCATLPGYAQNVVTGRVTSQNGEGLPGVNVVLKGSTIGAITDTDGNFKINAPVEGTLVFSFIGYKTVEIPLNGQSVVNPVLEEDVTTLDQVVVIGYGTQKKKDITTAVVVVDESAIQGRPMVSAAEALQGKAAGVQVVQPSGKPGGDISVRIRGATSVLAGNEPLYVVDGIPTTDIRGLNPQDIASMSVLKDAASASIYGARAANGVVLITTKRGKVNEAPVISFNAYAGFSKLRKTIDVLNTEQYKTLMADVPAVGAIDPTITNYTNWSDKVFGTGVNQSYQLSVAGGNEKSRYMISGNYLKNDGIIKPASFDRYSLRLNLDNDVRSWLKVGTTLNFLNSRTKDTPDNLSSGRGGVIMSALNTPPFLNVYKDDGSGQFDPNPFAPSWENPIAYMEGPDQLVVDKRLFGNLTADFKLLKDLTYRTNLGIDINQHNYDYYLDPFRTVYGRTQNGAGQSQRKSSNTWLWENTLTYTKSLGDNNFTVLLGTSTQENKTDDAYIAGHDFPEDTSVKTLNAANIIDDAYTTKEEWSLASFFGRVTYDYKGKYLLTGSIRRDGSSKLASKWGTMPSFSAGWRISSEPFMENLSFINDMKLRAGWGTNGNQEGISNYSQYGLISYTRVTPTTPLAGPAIKQTTYGNPDLKWETTDQTSLGLDVSVLESRVTLTLDAYLKKTKDVLLNVQLPSSSEIAYIQTNAGKIENKGIEMNISTVNVDQAITWTTDFNISFNRNKVTSLKLSDVYYYGNIYSNDQDVIIIKAGLPLGSFFGYVSEGVDPVTGNIAYKDLNGNGLINTDDRTVIGNGQPNFIFGLTNSLSYKRFDLNFFFQGSQGNDVYNATRIDLEGMFDSKNQSTAVLNRWTPENTNTDIPKAGGDFANVSNSTRFVEDGSYVRLKTITLAYNFKPEFLESVHISKMSLYATGQNLLTFTNYSGFDPEVNAYETSAPELGVDYGTYPQARTIIFGVKLDF